MIPLNILMAGSAGFYPPLLLPFSHPRSLCSTLPAARGLDPVFADVAQHLHSAVKPQGVLSVAAYLNILGRPQPRPQQTQHHQPAHRPAHRFLVLTTSQVHRIWSNPNSVKITGFVPINSSRFFNYIRLSKKSYCKDTG